MPSTPPSGADLAAASTTTTTTTIRHSDSGIDMSADLRRATEKEARKQAATAAALASLLPPGPIAAAGGQDGFLHHSAGAGGVGGGEVKNADIAGDFFAAWGGISSVGLGLPILHTSARSRRSVDLPAPTMIDVARLCCAATAAQVGLSHRKGHLRVGMDADVCVFDEDERWTLRSGGMHWKNRCSPWEGKAFEGRVKATWVRGRLVYAHGGGNGGFVGGVPVGEAIVERRVR